MVRLVPSLLLVAALAGCLGGPGETAAPEDAPGDGSGADPDPVEGPPSATAPTLSPGDWWRWEVTGRNFGTFEVTTVVARAGPGGYGFGATERAPALHGHLFHVPPLGAVGTDLGWTAHGHPVDLVRFPLSDGGTWEGSIEGRPVAFTAQAVQVGDRTVFEVDGRFLDFDGQGPRLVYDPALGMFSEVALHYGGDVPFSTARVVASGHGHEGEVQIHDARDKFLGGRGGLPSIPDPVAGFSASQQKEWLVFGCYLGGSTGHFEIQYIPPVVTEDPVRCAFRNGGAAFDNEVQVLWRSSVPGDWTVAFGVAGSGYAEAEVIGVLEETCSLGGGSTDASPCS